MNNNKIQQNDNNFSEKVTARIDEILDQNLLFMHHELHILEVLIKRYPLLTINEYAEKKKISPNGVRYKCDAGSVCSINIGQKTFIIDF